LTDSHLNMNTSCGRHNHWEASIYPVWQAGSGIGPGSEGRGWVQAESSQAPGRAAGCRFFPGAWVGRTAGCGQILPREAAGGAGCRQNLPRRLVGRGWVQADSSQGGGWVGRAGLGASQAGRLILPRRAGWAGRIYPGGPGFDRAAGSGRRLPGRVWGRGPGGEAGKG